MTAVTQLPPPQEKQEQLRFMIQYHSYLSSYLTCQTDQLRMSFEGDTVALEGSTKQELSTAYTPVHQNFNTEVLISYFCQHTHLTVSRCKIKAVMQNGQPVAYGSRALTDCQCRYEKELLTIVYRCDKFHQYVYRKDINVENDHKLLDSTCNRLLHQSPMRLQRLVTRRGTSYCRCIKHSSKCGRKIFLEKESEVNRITLQLPISEKNTSSGEQQQKSLKCSY